MTPYTIKRTAAAPGRDGNWDGPVWSAAHTGIIANYLPNSSDHHPQVEFRMLYDASWLYLLFRVADDRYIRCVHTEFNSAVCRDSCTEFFVEPNAGGYFNFEVNCGGTMLVYYIQDATRVGEGFAQSTALTAEEAAQVQVYHSLPAVVEPELPGPVTWYNEIHIPLALLAKYAGTLGDPAGQTWRANLYKCGDETSHPHWGTWAPIEGESFHVPQFFAPLVFEG